LRCEFENGAAGGGTVPNLVRALESE